MGEPEENRRQTRTVMSILRTGDVLNRYLEIELAKHGSSPIRFGVMNALFVHGGTMKPTDISKWIFRAKQTVTGMLHILESIGFIRREPSGNDGRSVDMVVTEQGRKATERMIPIAEEISQRALSCLDEEQIETLTNLLKQFRKHLFKQINASQSIKAKGNRAI